MVPEGAKIVEGFPVPRMLETVLNARYAETCAWIDGDGDGESDGGEVNESASSDSSAEGAGTNSKKTSTTSPTNTNTGAVLVEKIVALNAPRDWPLDTLRHFLVFRQHCNDYARLCVERREARGKNAESRDKVSERNTPLPLDSPTDCPNVGGAGFEGFRLYRTYASFFHALVGSNERASVFRARPPRNETSGGVAGEADQPVCERNDEVSPAILVTTESAMLAVVAETATGTDVKTTTTVVTATTATNITAANTTAPSLVATATMSPSPPLPTASAKTSKTQSHSFRAHPLPSPELPQCDPRAQSDTPVQFVVFAVHGVGQRVWRKMGFHFNRDCDDLRNRILDAAAVRNVPSGAIAVLPVSWRAELDLAGNFAFGDAEGDEKTAATGDAEGDEKSAGTEAASAATDDNAIATNAVPNENNPTSPRIIPSVPPAHINANKAPVAGGQFYEILERLTLESIPSVRSILSDATMDILLYVSPQHFERVLRTVTRELTRLHRLFQHWNPGFSGEFSFVAHSLGSALAADLLSWTVQPDELLAVQSDADTMELVQQVARRSPLPFHVDKFFAMGSPLGVLHLLRHTKPIGCIQSPCIEAELERRMERWRAARLQTRGAPVDNVPSWTLYNCRLFYNVFHPHDPVAHRFESLTRTSDSLSPPLRIPYHKSGLTRFKMDLEAKLARARSDWSRSMQNITMRLPAWLGGSSRAGVDEGASSPPGSASLNSSSLGSSPAPSSAALDDPLAAFNHRFSRADFSLQDSFIENPYLSAIGAHFVYWSDMDVAAFIVSELIKTR